ncbi:MAG: response regulator [Lachnospiraceae bacterium]|nr:response regulator [Lachnospiraceae bacterium]
MNVLIVDDQQRVLDVMEKLVDWGKLKIEGVFTADSAKTAKEILDGESIDIMLTDIEMPGEDGIALQKWQSEHYPEVSCIFLTSHADFSYAKEAIHNGVFDYILQPAGIPEIEETVSRCIDHIEEQRLLQVKSVQYDARLSETLETHVFAMFHQRSHFLNMKEWQIDSHTEEDGWRYLPCLVEFRWKKGRLTEVRESLNQRIQTEAQAEKMIAVTSCLDGEHIGVILYEKNAPSNDTALRERLGAVLLQPEMEKQWKAEWDCCVFVGNFVRDELPGEIELLFRFCTDRILKKNWVYLVDPVKTLELRRPDSSIWGRWLIRGDKALVRNQITNLLQYAQEENALTVSYMQELMHTFLEACSIASFEQKITLPAPASEVFSYQRLTTRCTSAEQLITVVDEVFCQYENLLPGQEDGEPVYSIQERIREVLRYLDENMDRMISRREAAKYVFLNEDYFSRMFLKETGMRYKEYLLKHKMDYAGKLLVETDLPVTLIASKVGYENFTNFSKMFRKVMGVTPTDYRKNGSSGEKKTYQ